MKNGNPEYAGSAEGGPQAAAQTAGHGKVFYGNSSEVHRVGYKDFNEQMKNAGRKQSMEGFEPDYLDFVDYIQKVTHRIWEEKGIGTMYRTFHNDVTMHSGSASIQGLRAMISNNLQTLYAYPDRRLIGENVIWSGDDKNGFYSSHRMLSTATNLGESGFGPPTYKKIAFRTIVDTFVHANRIIEGWQAKDNLHIVRQLGFDPHETAQRLARQAKRSASGPPHYGIPETMRGQLLPEVYERRSTRFEIGDMILHMYNTIWEWRLFHRVKDFYADAAIVHYIENKDLTGFDQIQGMLIGLFASFPNAKFIVERVTCNQRESERDWDVAVRWRLQGLHEGIGFFGRPSHGVIEVAGISNLVVCNEKIVEEWIVYDGLDVLKQIYSRMDNFD